MKTYRVPVLVTSEDVTSALATVNAVSEEDAIKKALTGKFEDISYGDLVYSEDLKIEFDTDDRCGVEDLGYVYI